MRFHKYFAVGCIQVCGRLFSSVFGFLVLVQAQYMIDKTKTLDDKILLGYAFRKLTMKTVDECFFHCYEDCFCMAFQMCQSTECQLLSTNQFQSSSALVTMKGCSYYDMLPDFEQVKKFTAVDGLWNFRT